MEKRKHKYVVCNNKSAWLFLIIYALVFLIGGFVTGGMIGEQQGYETGLKDGVQSTLLIDADNECEVVRYSRFNHE